MGALVQEHLTAKTPSYFIINTSKAFVNLVGRVSLSLIFITGDTGSQSRSVMMRRWRHKTPRPVFRIEESCDGMENESDRT